MLPKFSSAVGHNMHPKAKPIVRYVYSTFESWLVNLNELVKFSGCCRTKNTAAKLAPISMDNKKTRGENAYLSQTPKVTLCVRGLSSVVLHGVVKHEKPVMTS